ncbi:MAG: hypothetical protein KC636_38965 [Myxococcales bacterium]|nr:hypothetical protein [Myxococcales bacterium]
MMRRVIIVAVAGALACKGSSDAEPAKAEVGVEAPGPAQPVAAPAAESVEARLLAWLDPDARAVAFVRNPGEFDATAVATLFGVPGAGERVLRQLAGVDDGFTLMIGDDALATWFLEPALAMWPVIAQGTYVVRLLQKPAAEFRAAMEEAGMRASEVEGMTVLVSESPYAWKLVLLEGDAVAFVPQREIGSGLGPLTAARDLPPSELRQQLAPVLADSQTVLELFLAGPDVHMDLREPVASVRLSLRRWQTTGLDGAITLQPLGDVDEAARALQGRRATYMTDKFQDLMTRVAFAPEGPIVLGRLQIPGTDLDAIQADG